MNVKFLSSPVIYTSLLIALTGGMISCGETVSTKSDTKEVAEDANDAKFDSAKNEKDAQFMVNAAEVSLEEIKLGQLAQQKSTSPDIKSLGKMMAETHTKALSDLRGLAQSKTISLPDSATQNALDAYATLADMKASDFDIKYCDMMVNGHKDVIGKFEKASADVSDPQIKQWASAMIPDLRKHMDMALTCRNKLEKKN